MQATAFVLSTNIKGVVIIVTTIPLRLAATTVPTLSWITKAVVTVAALRAGSTLIKGQRQVSALAANTLAEGAGGHPFRKLTVCICNTGLRAVGVCRVYALASELMPEIDGAGIVVSAVPLSRNSDLTLDSLVLSLKSLANGQKAPVIQPTHYGRALASGNKIGQSHPPGRGKLDLSLEPAVVLYGKTRQHQIRLQFTPIACKPLLLQMKIRIGDTRIENFHTALGVSQPELFFEHCRPSVLLLHSFAEGGRVSEHQDPVASRGLILRIVVAISQTEIINPDRRSTGDTLTAWQEPGQRGALTLSGTRRSLVHVVAGVAVCKGREEGSLLLGLCQEQRQIQQQDSEQAPAKQRQEPRRQETRLRLIRRHMRNLAGLALLSCLIGCKGAPRDMSPPEDPGVHRLETEQHQPGSPDEQHNERDGSEHPEAIRQGGRVQPSEDAIVEHWEDEYFPFIDYVREAPFDSPGPLKARSEPVELADEVLIQGGVATIGDEAIPGARPIHSVTLKSYYIDRFEVSNLRYQEFVRATKRDTPYVHENWAAIYNWFRDSHPKGLGEVPVVMVTWTDADAFCRWSGRRLPSEYEWERAARGSEARPYPWGATFDSQKANLASRLSGPLQDRDGWDRFEKSWTGSKKPEIASVGSYPEDRSAEGVMDMAGNVNEWVAGYFVAYPKANTKERKGFDEKLRVARGNSWGNRDYSSSMAVRYPYREDRVDSLIGFRCARDAE